MTDIEIVAPTPEAGDRLRADFAESAVTWTERADRAAGRGEWDKALAFELIARIAASVSRGGPPCST